MGGYGLDGPGSEGDWRNAAHFDLLQDEVLAMRRLEHQRLCVSLPPGGGKSEYLSARVASWWVGTRPNDRVVIASYGRDLAVDPCTRARNYLADYGLEVFGVQASRRDKAAWWCPRDEGLEAYGGFVYAVGRGGALTGKRAELLIVDDLFKDDLEAQSPAIRDAAWRWLEKVALTRLLPWSCVIVIGTRWHRDDHIGRLEEQQRKGRYAGGLPWRLVNVPALAVEGPDLDPLGREEGDSYWPEQFPAEYLASVRDGMAPRGWSCLYQGSPVPEGGGMFRADWLRHYERHGDELVAEGLRVPLERCTIYSTADLAGSRSQRADYTVIATWASDPQTKTLWLLDVVRDRLEGPGIIAALRDVQATHEPRMILVEEAGFALGVVHRLRFAEAEGGPVGRPDQGGREVVRRAVEAGLPVKAVKPDRDKVTRAMPATAVMAQGRVYVLESASWRYDWEDEVLSFPDGTHDDQVDALSMAVDAHLKLQRRGQAVVPAGAIRGGHELWRRGRGRSGRWW